MTFVCTGGLRATIFLRLTAANTVSNEQIPGELKPEIDLRHHVGDSVVLPVSC